MAVDERAESLMPILQEGRPDARGWLARRAVFAGIWLLLILLTISVPETQASWISLGVIYAIVGLSINVLIGYAGQVSLGHAAFVGVGAFTSALLTTKSGLPFGLAVVLAMGTGAFAAILLGMVALRLRGLYLALITLAYGEVTTDSIFGIPALTGGGAGVAAPRPAGFAGNVAFALLTLVFLATVLYVDNRYIKSKAGRAIFAIRENEIAAASFGINVMAYKLMAFVFSGAIAGLAGALLAHRTGFIAPKDFTFQLSLTFVLMTAVGGLGSRAGIFIGSAFFAIFPLAFNRFTNYTIGAGALLLLLTLTMFPGGIGQQIRPVTDWLSGKRFSFKGENAGIHTGGGGVRP